MFYDTIEDRYNRGYPADVLVAEVAESELLDLLAEGRSTFLLRYRMLRCLKQLYNEGRIVCRSEHRGPGFFASNRCPYW